MKILVLIRHSPFSQVTSREAQELAFALAAVEHQVSVCYLAEGVLHLVETASNAAIGAKDFTVQQKLFGLYEIEQAFACQDALQQFGVTLTSRMQVQPVSMAALAWHEFDWVVDGA